MPNEQASHGVSPAPPPPSATAGKLIRNWAPIAAAILAVVLVAAILLLHYHLRINTNQANKWKHILAMVGAAFALVGSLFQGGKSHARASHLNGDDSRFFHHVGILWWILSFGALLALAGEVLDF
jgi:hypothetical protein